MTAVTIPAEIGSTPIILFLYTISMVGFFAAAGIAVQNYRQTKSISNYWIMFLLTMLLGGAVSAVFFLQNAGVAPVFLDEIDRLFVSMFLILLIVTGIETITTPIDVTIE